MSTPHEPRRIAYFALDLPHKGQASYVHIHEIVENLKRLGWEVDLFTPPPGSPEHRPSVFKKANEYVRTMRRALAKLGTYDVLYVRAHALAWPVSVAGGRRGLAVVQEVNGTEVDLIVSRPWLRPLRGFLRWLYVSQYRRASHLFPVAKELGEWLRARTGHDRITVVPNAANTDLFRPIDRAPVDPFVVFFGGLTDWHGIEVMIEAVRHPEWPKRVELVIIGAGARQSAVEAAVGAGLPIRWLGHRPYGEIPGLIAGAIAGLNPITDPLGRAATGMNPLKLYEMLASGLAAIVTDLPGQAELVAKGGCGLVIPPGDPAALARAVAELAADPVLAHEMGRRGTELVHAAHSWRTRAATIDQVLRRCLAPAAR